MMCTAPTYSRALKQRVQNSKPFATAVNKESRWKFVKKVLQSTINRKPRVFRLCDRRFVTDCTWLKGSQHKYPLFTLRCADESNKHLTSASIWRLRSSLLRWRTSPLCCLVPLRYQWSKTWNASLQHGFYSS